MCLACGEFISDFKTAKVAPIHKKGSVTNVCNYRKISLLCSMSKILEQFYLKQWFPTFLIPRTSKIF